MDPAEQIQLVEHDLAELVKLQTRGAVIRSQANWALNTERPTKYFLNLEKKRALSKTLQRLKTETGQTLTDGKEILQEISQFYVKLYTTNGDIDKTLTENLEVPKLSEEIKQQLDARVDIAELGSALKEMANG